MALKCDESVGAASLWEDHADGGIFGSDSIGLFREPGIAENEKAPYRHANSTQWSLAQRRSVLEKDFGPGLSINLQRNIHDNVHSCRLVGPDGVCDSLPEVFISVFEGLFACGKVECGRRRADHSPVQVDLRAHR